MKSWKTYLALTALFFCGAIVGAAGTLLVVRWKLNKVVAGGPAAARQVVMKRLISDLNLTAEQADETQGHPGDPDASQQEDRRTHLQRSEHVDEGLGRQEGERGVEQPHDRGRIDELEPPRAGSIRGSPGGAAPWSPWPSASACP